MFDGAGPYDRCHHDPIKRRPIVLRVWHCSPMDERRAKLITTLYHWAIAAPFRIRIPNKDKNIVFCRRKCQDEVT